MTSGLVSVMMPAYNAGRYIADAIQSVVAQSYPHWELLVVDDGSTDETAAIAAGVADPRIRLLRKENGGESTARNMALEHARGEFVAFLDADDAWFPHHLDVTVGYLRTHTDRHAVYTDGFHIDEHGLRLTTLQSRRRGPFEGRVYEQVVLASDVFGPPICVVLRHRLVAERGLRYDPRIVIGPDWDFFVRFAEVGAFGYVADQTTLYRVHQTNITSRVDFDRRAGYLALCRENAIRTPAFAVCSVATRAAVFYDLLVPLLRGQAEHRAEAVAWPEFSALPAHEQARLLRLMAADAILAGEDRRLAGVWLERACALNPGDARARVLARAHRLGSAVSYGMLRAMGPFRGDTRRKAPFADLESARRASRRSAPA